MAYGTIKIDTITFTDGGVDKSVSISGLVQNPTFSGDITVTGTVSGNTIRGQTVSGVTVTGTTALFSTGTFISLTGTTSQGTTATYTSGSFTSLTGVTTAGTTANFVSGVFSTQISGATVTGNAGAFTTLTGGVTTVTSGVFAAGSASNPSISFTSDPNTGIYSPGADQVAISTGGSGRLFVDASGRVGVGTSAPSTLLHIQSTDPAFRFKRSDAGTDAYGELTTDTSGLVTMKCDPANAAAGSGFRITVDNSEALRVDSSGRLGIGTSSPSNDLDVLKTASGSTTTARIGATATSGANNATLILNNGGTGNATLRFDYEGSTNRASIGVLASDQKLTFGTAGSTAMTIDASQRLGIGTTTVDVKTQIVKNALTKSWSADGDDVLAIENSGTTNVDFRSGSSSSTYLMFSDGDARARGYVAYLHSSDALLLGAANSERARIDSSGRLLVGTSSARSNDLFGTSQSQVEGTDSATSSISITRNVAAVGAGGIALCKSRSSSIGGVTVVQSGDVLGFIDFQGADGTDFARAATIAAEVDGTPGNNDMPGRLVFSTTADGASSPTERMRLNNLGYLTGTVNGLGNGLYLANQFYRLNSGNVGSNATGAQSVFGVGVNLIADTVYAFESFYVLQKSAGTTSHTIAVSFGGTAGLNNISYGIIWNRDNTTAASSNMSGIAGAYQSFATSASSLVLTSAIASSGQTVTLKLSGTVSISTAGTFIPQYTLSAAPGGAYTTLAGSYFKIAALGASGANTSIGSWA